MFAARTESLRAALDERRLVALLVTSPANIAYVTGFRGSAGVLLLSREGAILWVDPRYTLQAREEARGTEVIEARQGLLRAAGTHLSKHARGKVGFEDADLTTRSFADLRKHSGKRVRFVPEGGMLGDSRYVKDAHEIATIREAGRVTVEALAEVLPRVRPGMREDDIAAEFEFRVRQKGAEGVAFESIVASGPRGALPHARTSRKLLEKCDLVIMDVGGIINGYAADMTRTYYLGEPNRRVRRLYNAVLEAQERGVAALREGVRAGTVDRAARSVLGQKGLGRYFTHSTGHGVGLEVHERPRLEKGVKARIKENCVVTVEPGIYLEGFGGIRLEDTVLVGANGPEILTPASKTDWVLS